jgi:ATP-dependent Clp protease protease subunit
VEKVAEDTERDNWLTAEEALEYGLVDKIIEKRPDSDADKKDKE